MPGKAYRWEGEMEEISGFVKDGLSKTDRPAEQPNSPALIHLGLAGLYNIVATELVKPGEGQVAHLREWAAEAHKLLDSKKR
jgi:hypothetical protein